MQLSWFEGLAFKDYAELNGKTNMECQEAAVMALDDFETVLRSEINPYVSGVDASRLSSVLIIIYGSPPKILMTKKSSHLKIHAGEIAFPGGKFDDSDADLLCTALRETREELNLNISRSQVIGQLKPVRTLNSNFTIIPFVSVVEYLPKITCNPEVELVLHIPARSFLKTLRDDPDPDHNTIQEMYTFTFEEYLIWGASARMLKQIVDRLAEMSLL